MGKYIIELKRGETAYKTVDSNGTPLIQLLAPIPYTEPDLEQVRCAAYEEGRNSLLIEVQKAGKNTIKLEEDEYYQRGLEDAWEAARKICLNECDGGMTPTEVNKIFGVGFYRDALLESASEAIEKIRQYEQEKEKDRQARIEYNFDEIKDVLETTVKECNVSLDEIAAVLEKMREG